MVYVLIWVSLYFVPRRVYHVGGDNNLEPWILFAVFFIVLPLVLYSALRSYNIAAKTRTLAAMASVFLVLPFVWITSTVDDQELSQYRKETTGIIVKAWLNDKRKQSDIWSVQAVYHVNGRRYQTPTNEDRDRTLENGDTVSVVYSSRTPEISEIRELQVYYNR